MCAHNTGLCLTYCLYSCTIFMFHSSFTNGKYIYKYFLRNNGKILGWSIRPKTNKQKTKHTKDTPKIEEKEKSNMNQGSDLLVLLLDGKKKKKNPGFVHMHRFFYSFLVTTKFHVHFTSFSIPLH